MIKRVTSIFSILMIFMFTIGQSYIPIIASAQELNKTGLVDSFTLDKTELGYGERTGIKVNFSDKSGNQMKTGDTLTLTLPPELQGYSRTIPLKNEAGTDFGTCQITSTNVVCTFSDVVEKLQNIRGFFKFEVQATKDVATGQTLTVDTNLGTNLQTQRITIKGPTEGGGGTAPFSYKAGRMDADAPTEVKWEIPINNNKQQLGADIVLSDTAQSGQTLNLDSFVLGNENLTPQQFMDRGYGTITFNGNSFEIRIYKDYVSGQSFNIRYRTNITESGMKQKTFVNKYTINYQILNEQPVSFSGEAWTDNINSDGGADGDLPPKGTLRIVKHIEGNTEKFIPDVSFKLYTESGQQIGNTYKTDEKGIVEVPDLNPGNYYVQEISAPNYLDFDPQAKVNFTIDRNAEKGVKLMIPNKVKTTSVSGTKIWDDYNNKFGKRPESITVQLLQNGTELKTQEVKADQAGNWNFDFKDLPKYDEQGNEYKYTVSEVKVNDYETKVEGTTITNTYKNTDKTELSGKKVWDDYNNKFGKRPESITVQLLQNGTEFKNQEVKADQAGNWNFSFTDLPKYDEQGNEYKYTVSEVKVDGYETKVDGTTITNTYKNTEVTEVSGKKVWDDYNNKFGKRPESITVQLLQNGTELKTQEVKADQAGNWNFDFKDLPKYDEQGNEYKYTVSEVKVNDYETKVEGTTITNTYKNTETTEVSGKKVWDDYNNKFNKRPESITVQLLQNGTELKTQEVKADQAGNWNFDFKDLPKYDGQGNEYTYTVGEVKVDGYETKVEGTTITNTYKNTETTELNGKKVWDDYNNKFGKRPESITVQLLQNGTELKTQEVKSDKDGNWNFDFKDLPKYDEQGNEYMYTVGEVKVDGYETKVEGTTITNTYKNTDKTELNGKKVWDDYNNKFNTRPESITVQLLQNGTELKTQEVKADQAGNWNFSFTDLPKYDEQGNEYKYTVSEVKIDGYETKVEGTTITNTYKNTEVTELSGKKVWDDYNNKFNKRPESITVQLLQNEKELKTQEVKADQAGNWNFSFTDLPKYDGQGNEYKYTVSEVKVDGYETKVEGTTITNTYKNTETTEVSGKKIWDDYNNKFGKRPESITVQLLQNGTEFKNQEVKADQAGNWNFSFTDLSKYDEQGNEYKYTVNEVKVNDYETKVEGTTITNTYKNTEVTELSGKKVWDDYNNKFNKRPESITVQLLQNEKELKTQEVKADQTGNWNFNFKDLPKYDEQGNEYTYTVGEVKVDGYETKVEGTTITNTYKNTETTEVSGKKIWDDYNNKFGKRPESITVQLLQNGTEFKNQEVKADQAGNWNFSFTDLSKYDEQGNEYKYTVNEVKVNDYETKVEGTTITNTYKNTEVTELSGKKVWDDYNNKFNKRPESITVQLLQNEKELKTQEVKADQTGNWNFNFKDLPKYDEQGNEYKYTVGEVKVDGYETKVEGTTITNTYKNTETTEVSGKKTWKDDNAKDRPEMIKVDLLQNGKVIATQEVSAASEWKYAFKDLAAYDENGVAYKYEVKEQPVDGYKSEVKGNDITNTKVGKTKVEGTKTWNDGNATNRPKTIKVDLLQNGQVIATQEVSEATGWKYTFKELAAYDANGAAYKYEVKEQPVEGYQSEVNGFDITNTKIKDNPSTEPKDPSTDPNANTDTNSDSKVPPTKENAKTSVELPKTGGTSMDIISYIGGMLLVALGGFIFARQRMR